MKKAFAVIAWFGLVSAGALAFAQSTETVTHAFTITGTAPIYIGNCLALSKENGSSLPSGYYYCPTQPCSTCNYDSRYQSLYLLSDYEDSFSGIMEDMPVTYGQPYNQTYNSDGTLNTYSRTDMIVEGDGSSSYPNWTGTVSQQFTRYYYTSCGRFGCHPTYNDYPTGGTGHVTQ